MASPAALTANELTDMRSHVSTLLLTDTCTIQTLTRSDDKGSWSNSWANTHANVGCRIAPINKNQAERILGSELQSVSAWVLTVAHNQAIAPEDRVVHDSVTYEILTVMGTHSDRTAKRILLGLAE